MLEIFKQTKNISTFIKSSWYSQSLCHIKVCFEPSTTFSQSLGILEVILNRHIKASKSS